MPFHYPAFPATAPPPPPNFHSLLPAHCDFWILHPSAFALVGEIPCFFWSICSSVSFLSDHIPPPPVMLLTLAPKPHFLGTNSPGGKIGRCKRGLGFPPHQRAAAGWMEPHLERQLSPRCSAFFGRQQVPRKPAGREHRPGPRGTKVAKRQPLGRLSWHF